ncbi:hypothetical protein M441DRAFT_321970 [Trichoderma asperellum CBS 433.97]|uniref:Uncharacterized protein n=1 Tax=Trichoderma asperellum (strain ATCC 204424 / CBS 433.97 / NBRC 101777) TaxID=1042311 RepID=A0A2T3ZLG0_TRIA4|nr:hypothetical protein M441DRAFT_321970 [Trichoderma asperellum CBS 433.97]PTB45645.1 hypothetical protein M441DRAFT_321970 [Trichoderma asperellum CBS 433.97]
MSTELMRFKAAWSEDRKTTRGLLMADALGSSWESYRVAFGVVIAAQSSTQSHFSPGRIYSVLSVTEGTSINITEICIQDDEREVDKVRGERKRDERARHSDSSGARAYIHAESQQTGAWASSSDKVSLASGERSQKPKKQKQAAKSNLKLPSRCGLIAWTPSSGFGTKIRGPGGKVDQDSFNRWMAHYQKSCLTLLLSVPTPC